MMMAAGIRQLHCGGCMRGAAAVRGRGSEGQHMGCGKMCLNVQLGVVLELGRERDRLLLMEHLW